MFIMLSYAAGTEIWQQGEQSQIFMFTLVWDFMAVGMFCRSVEFAGRFTLILESFVVVI